MSLFQRLSAPFLPTEYVTQRKQVSKFNTITRTSDSAKVLLELLVVQILKIFSLSANRRGAQGLL